MTPQFNAGGLCGCVYQPNVIGVWYDSANDEWAVLREDGGAMPASESYNVLVVPKKKQGHSVFVQTATSSNTTGDYTLISNKQTTGNPNNVTFATQKWNPGGGEGTCNAVQTGVWYTGTKEGVFNEDQSTMPLNASFNVLIFPG